MTIFPSFSTDIARRRKSKSSIVRMIPVSTIVSWFVSWFWPVWYLVLVPTEWLEIFTYCTVFSFYLSFFEWVGFPVFRIESILEHIDTCMSDIGEFLMDLLYIFERFSWFWVRESEDEVDIEWYSLILNVCVYSRKCTHDAFSVTSMNRFQGFIIQALDADRKTIHSEF